MLKHGIGDAFPSAMMGVSREFLDAFNAGEYDELLETYLLGAEEKKMKTIERLEKVIKETAGTVLILENVIKGFSSPCCICEGCETKDNHRGLCGGFILAERDKK